MSDKPSPSPPSGSDAAVEAPPAPAQAPQARRKKSVFQYIAILFAAAFFLLLYTFLMERRQNELLQQENREQLSNLQQSVSAVQSLENLYQENEALRKELAALQSTAAADSGELSSAREQILLLQDTVHLTSRQRNAALNLYLLENQMRLEDYEQAALTYRLLMDDPTCIVQAGDLRGFDGVAHLAEIGRELIALDCLSQEEAGIGLLEDLLTGGVPSSP